MKIFFVALALILSTALPANAAITATSLEIRGEVATGSHTWDKSGFAGFFYDIDNNLGNETLRIFTSGDQNRTIAESSLIYSTHGQSKPLKVVTEKYASAADAAAHGLENFSAGKMAPEAGNFTIEGWLSEKYVAIKRQPNKLSRLLVEHGLAAADKKTLAVNETWDMGSGYSLTATYINANASPREVLLTFKKDGILKDVKLVTSGGVNATPIYTYSEKSFCNETDVPVLVTYVDSIFKGATSDMVQFRYTWLISSTCTEVMPGDTYGSLKVTNTDPIELKNSESSLTLSADTTISVAGDIKLKVADDTTSLRYYPFVLKTAPGTYEVRGSVATGSHAWDNSTFAGFFYDIDDNLGRETLSIITSGADSRTIAESQLTYSTFGQSKPLKVSAKFPGYAAYYGLENFGAGKMAVESENYTIVGWQGEQYVAIKMQPNKLSKLLVEHGFSASDKKTLTVGETWNISEGWALTARSIDAKATPRQVWLTLTKDGVIKDEKVVTSGGTASMPIYTYTEMYLCGEIDVPVLVTYVDSIFAGSTSDMVQFRYTWLISSNCSEIRSGNAYGLLKVTNTDPVQLRNSEYALTLSRGATLDILGNIKLRVADDAMRLRYYPFVIYEIITPPLPPGPFDTMKFEPGAWNLVSVPKTLVNSSVDAAFVNLSFDMNNVKWSFNAAGSSWERPSSIDPLRGYWVYNNASTPIYQEFKYKNMSGPNVPPSMTLKAGWNLIGHTSTKSMPVDSALVSIKGKYSHLLSYTPNDGWKMYIVGNPSLQQFSTFEPGKGYWIFMTEEAIYAAVDI